MIKNRTIRLGDNVDTDQIIGAQHLRLPSIEAMAPFLFEVDPVFTKDYKEGNIVVGGRNFGCGSSREQAPAVMIKRGIQVVLAKSFARIFYRNAINLGLILIVLDKVDEINHGDTLSIDTEKGIIHNESTSLEYPFLPVIMPNQG